MKIYLTIFVFVATTSLAAFGKAVYLTVPPATLNLNTVYNLKMVKMNMKKCSKCDATKPLGDFGNDKSRKDGLFTYCKECSAILALRYRRTKNGLITQIYSGQKKISKRRNNESPKYTKQELAEWCFNQELFHELYDNWEASGFNVNLAPSCDRTNDYLGYSLSRLQLMTWHDNFHKSTKDRRNGINNKVNKPVVGINKITGNSVEYHSVNEAGRKSGIAFTSISACCLGKRQSAGGYKWNFA